MIGQKYNNENKKAKNSINIQNKKSVQDKIPTTIDEQIRKLQDR